MEISEIVRKTQAYGFHTAQYGEKLYVLNKMDCRRCGNTGKVKHYCVSSPPPYTVPQNASHQLMDYSVEDRDCDDCQGLGFKTYLPPQLKSIMFSVFTDFNMFDFADTNKTDSFHIRSNSFNGYRYETHIEYGASIKDFIRPMRRPYNRLSRDIGGHNHVSK